MRPTTPGTTRLHISRIVRSVLLNTPGIGHDAGFHVFTMKPGFREAFGDLEFPLPNKDGVPGLTEWRIRRSGSTSSTHI